MDLIASLTVQGVEPSQSNVFKELAVPPAPPCRVWPGEVLHGFTSIFVHIIYPPPPRPAMESWSNHSHGHLRPADCCNLEQVSGSLSVLHTSRLIYRYGVGHTVALVNVAGAFPAVDIM